MGPCWSDSVYLLQPESPDPEGIHRMPTRPRHLGGTYPWKDFNNLVEVSGAENWGSAQQEWA